MNIHFVSNGIYYIRTERSSPIKNIRIELKLNIIKSYKITYILISAATGGVYENDFIFQTYAFFIGYSKSSGGMKYTNIAIK